MQIIQKKSLRMQINLERPRSFKKLGSIFKKISYFVDSQKSIAGGGV